MKTMIIAVVAGVALLAGAARAEMLNNAAIVNSSTGASAPALAFLGDGGGGGRIFDFAVDGGR